jgi:hypothetical protein
MKDINLIVYNQVFSSLGRQKTVAYTSEHIPLLKRHASFFFEMTLIAIIFHSLQPLPFIFQCAHPEPGRDFWCSHYNSYE